MKRPHTESAMREFLKRGVLAGVGVSLMPMAGFTDASVADPIAPVARAPLFHSRPQSNGAKRETPAPVAAEDGDPELGSFQANREAQDWFCRGSPAETSGNRRFEFTGASESFDLEKA